MTTPSNRTPLSATPSRRTPNENSPSRPTISSSVPSTGTGLARTPSVRQTRPLRKPVNRTGTSFAAGESEMEEEEAKYKNADLIQKLQERAEKAERAEQQYKQELQGMQQDLDKARQDQTTAEERDYQRQTDLDQFKSEINELKRHNRELERQHSEDEQLLQKEQDKHQDQQAQQQAAINRLNEALRLNGIERYNASRSAGVAEPQGPDADTGGRSDTHQIQIANLTHALQQREEAINGMRIDLAEAQLKLAEQQHTQDGRWQDLEHKISEYKVLNARLVEENENFVMLLSDKTLKGEFMHHDPAQKESRVMSSLAEELESTGETELDIGEGQSEAFKKLDSDNKALKVEIDALRLYIDKIIGRVLSHEGFQHIIQGKDEAAPPPDKAPSEKALPAIPDQQAPAVAATFAGAANGFLQRARSVVQRPGGKGRPMSYAQPTAPSPSANENPQTAPSIPLNRGHRRARSDQAQADLAAATVVQHMNRASPMRNVSGSPLSPSIRPLSPSLAPVPGSYFGAPPATATLTPSGPGNRGSSSANSMMSDSHSEEQKSNTDGSSIAPQVGAERLNQASIPGAVMKQNQLRPLRLVQEQTASEDEAAAKRANRGSIFGWFRGSTIESQDD